MSASEIIEELPRLTEQEKRLIRRRLVELAAENAEMDCNEAATQGALILDRMEEEDGRT